MSAESMQMPATPADLPTLDPTESAHILLLSRVIGWIVNQRGKLLSLQTEWTLNTSPVEVVCEYTTDKGRYYMGSVWPFQADDNSASWVADGFLGVYDHFDTLEAAILAIEAQLPALLQTLSQFAAKEV